MVIVCRFGLWLLPLGVVCLCLGSVIGRLIVLGTVASIVFYYVWWLCWRLCEFVVMMLYCVGLAGLL